MKAKQQGFTIIELTIATAVFSVILLIVTAGVISFSNSYIKGLNQSKTQQTARAVMDQLAQSIQFASHVEGPTTDPSGWSVYCVDNVKYSWKLKQRFTSDTGGMVAHALVRSPETGSDCSPETTFNASQDTELLGKGMQLYQLSPQKQTDGSWIISLALSYGDNDLLNANGSCKGGKGSQYCAWAQLSTVVQPRL